MTARPNDQGGVTAELALALPAVVLVLGVLFGTGTAAITQLRVVAAAGSAARELSRSASPSTVRGVVVAQAGAQARLSVTQTTDGQVSATVTRALALPLPGRPHVVARWCATAKLENPSLDGVSAPGGSFREN